MIPLDAIDVDFDSDPHDTGLIPQTFDEVLAGAESIVGSFEETYPQLMVPRSRRKEIASQKWNPQRATVKQIYSQSRTSACVGFGSAQALETTIVRRYGSANHVKLSGMSVYKEIGRTLMSGAYISDGMNQIVTTGALPLATPDNKDRFPLTWGLLDWSGRFPTGWERAANEFRVAKWATARGADEIESALLNDFTGIVGRSRHCVPYCGLTYEGRNSYAAYANSWGSDWGDLGWGYDSSRIYDNLTLFLILDVVVPDWLSTPAL